MNLRIVDLSHELSNGMPVFPGDMAPEITTRSVHDKDGFQELELKLTTHTGTHIDCPLHLFKDMMPLSSFDTGYFYGKATVIDCSSVMDKISPDIIQPYHQELFNMDYVLFFTGHDRWWGSEAYFKNYPVLTREAAGYLTQFRIRGVGFDTISPDRVDSTDLPVHRILLQNNMLIIENLTALGGVHGMDFFFSCFPLKIRGAEGSPVRAVAYLNED